MNKAISVPPLKKVTFYGPVPKLNCDRMQRTAPESIPKSATVSSNGPSVGNNHRVLTSRTRAPRTSRRPHNFSTNLARDSLSTVANRRLHGSSTKHRKVISGGQQIKTLLQCNHVDEGPVWGASSAKRNLATSELLKTDEEIKRRRIDRKIDAMVANQSSSDAPMSKHTKVMSDGSQIKTRLRCDHASNKYRKTSQQISQPEPDILSENAITCQSNERKHQNIKGKITLKSRLKEPQSTNVRSIYCNLSPDNEEEIDVIDVRADNSIDELDLNSRIPSQNLKGSHNPTSYSKEKLFQFDPNCKFCQCHNNENAGERDASGSRQTNAYISLNKSKRKLPEIDSIDSHYSGCSQNKLPQSCPQNHFQCQFCEEWAQGPLNARQWTRECCHCCPQFSKQSESTCSNCVHFTEPKKSENKDGSYRLQESKHLIQHQSRGSRPSMNLKENIVPPPSVPKNTKLFRRSCPEPHKCVHHYHCNSRLFLDPSFPGGDGGKSSCLSCGHREADSPTVYGAKNNYWGDTADHHNITKSNRRAVSKQSVEESSKHQYNVKFHLPGNRSDSAASLSKAHQSPNIETRPENRRPLLDVNKLDKKCLRSSIRRAKRDPTRSLALDDHL